MRISQTLAAAAALTPFASAQSIAEPTAASSLVSLDVIETFTTSFTGAQASLGNVTLYVPVPTLVPANATSGLLTFRNATATPIVVAAGNTSYIIPTGPARTALPTSFANGAEGPSRNLLAAGVAMGVAALLV